MSEKKKTISLPVLLTLLITVMGYVMGILLHSPAHSGAPSMLGPYAMALIAVIFISVIYSLAIAKYIKAIDPLLLWSMPSLALAAFCWPQDGMHIMLLQGIQPSVYWLYLAEMLFFVLLFSALPISIALSVHRKGEQEGLKACVVSSFFKCNLPQAVTKNAKNIASPVQLLVAAGLVVFASFFIFVDASLERTGPVLLLVCMIVVRFGQRQFNAEFIGIYFLLPVVLAIFSYVYTALSFSTPAAISAAYIDSGLVGGAKMPPVYYASFGHIGVCFGLVWYKKSLQAELIEAEETAKLARHLEKV